MCIRGRESWGPYLPPAIETAVRSAHFGRLQRPKAGGGQFISTHALDNDAEALALSSDNALAKNLPDLV